MANQNDKLLRLRSWILDDDDEWLLEARTMDLLDYIDQLLAEDEPEKPSETPGDEFIYKLGHMLDQKIETLRAVLRDGRDA